MANYFNLFISFGVTKNILYQRSKFKTQGVNWVGGFKYSTKYSSTEN